MPTALQNVSMDVSEHETSEVLLRLLEEVQQEMAPHPEPPAQPRLVGQRLPRPFAYD
jgi:hypothetical protein